MIIKTVIVRGTTPTIEFTFTQIDPSDITVAYLALKQNSQTVVEKSITDATVTSESVMFTLAQEDTLKLTRDSGVITLDWKTANGVRGRSNALEFKVEDPAKNEVI